MYPSHRCKTGDNNQSMSKQRRFNSLHDFTRAALLYIAHAKYSSDPKKPYRPIYEPFMRQIS
ncbi:MAG: hypothetical protein B7X37_03475 [Halothiobacillus sp. 14-55-98]|nr:MAG: hypothetical protein B7X37_03475 [Halothiobacillus sp. 14-55-98]